VVTGRDLVHTQLRVAVACRCRGGRTNSQRAIIECRVCPDPRSRVPAAGWPAAVPRPVAQNASQRRRPATITVHYGRWSPRSLPRPFRGDFVRMRDSWCWVCTPISPTSIACWRTPRLRPANRYPLRCARTGRLAVGAPDAALASLCRCRADRRVGR
jgi:hypothetical protein